MKISNLFIAGLTAVSFSAIAADEAKKADQSQGAQQPQASQESKSSAPQAASESKSESKSASQGASSDKHANADTVKKAQEKLNVQADGKMGPQTQAALKKFQQEKGLQASGQL